MMKTTPLLVSMLSAAAPWAMPLDGELVEIIIKVIAMALGPVAMFVALKMFKAARAGLRATSDQLRIVAKTMREDGNPENDTQARIIDHTANVLEAAAAELDDDPLTDAERAGILSRDPRVREATLAAAAQKRHNRGSGSN